MFDFRGGDELRRLAAHFRSAPDGMREGCARGMARVAENLIREGFDRGHDPSGKPWPLPKDGHRPPMIRSGELRRSIKAFVLRSGGPEVRIRSDVEYAKFLQNGTAKMDPRRFVPRGDLPPHWKHAFRIVFEDALEEWMSKPIRRIL